MRPGTRIMAMYQLVPSLTVFAARLTTLTMAIMSGNMLWDISDSFLSERLLRMDWIQEL